MLKILCEDTVKRIADCREHARKLDVDLRNKFDVDSADVSWPLRTYSNSQGKRVEQSADEYFSENYSVEARFEEKLRYLAEYANGEGCTYDRATGADTECRIGTDFAPLSFGFAMFCKKPGGVFEYWFNGGLIYNGPELPNDGSAPAFTVSLEGKTGWGIHT